MYAIPDEVPSDDCNASLVVGDAILPNDEASINQPAVNDTNGTDLPRERMKCNLDGYNQKRKKQQQKDKERGKQKPPLTALRKKQLNQVQ